VRPTAACGCVMSGRIADAMDTAVPGWERIHRVCRRVSESNSASTLDGALVYHFIPRPVHPVSYYGKPKSAPDALSTGGQGRLLRARAMQHGT
jgi:hypothetical protein